MSHKKTKVLYAKRTELKFFDEFSFSSYSSAHHNWRNSSSGNQTANELQFGVQSLWYSDSSMLLVVQWGEHNQPVSN